jgi:hypothetical protein
MPVEVQERVMRVSYDALVYTTAAVLPWMLAAGQGQIINIGSSAGKIFHGGVSAPYAAAKAAIDGYTQTLQAEFAGVIHLLVRPAVIAYSFFRHHPANMPRLADFCLIYLRRWPWPSSGRSAAAPGGGVPGWLSSSTCSICWRCLVGRYPLCSGSATWAGRMAFCSFTEWVHPGAWKSCNHLGFICLVTLNI